MFTIIPAIDIINGQVVRLTQGDYNQVQTYNQDPIELAKSYEKAGARRIHLVDLDGAKSGLPTNHKLFKKIKETVSCEIEIGGGIRDLDTAKSLIDAGIDYLILGSVLVKNKSISESIIAAFPNRIIAGIDEKNKHIAVSGWEEKSEMATDTFLAQLESYPLESIIFTEISRDGTLSGPDIARLKQITELSSKPIIASGGISCEADIDELAALNKPNLFGCITGKAILNGHIPLEVLEKSF